MNGTLYVSPSVTAWAKAVQREHDAAEGGWWCKACHRRLLGKGAHRPPGPAAVPSRRGPLLLPRLTHPAVAPRRRPGPACGGEAGPSPYMFEETLGWVP